MAHRCSFKSDRWVEDRSTFKVVTDFSFLIYLSVSPMPTVPLLLRNVDPNHQKICCQTVAHMKDFEVSRLETMHNGQLCNGGPWRTLNNNPWIYSHAWRLRGCVCIQWSHQKSIRRIVWVACLQWHSFDLLLIINWVFPSLGVFLTSVGEGLAEAKGEWLVMSGVLIYDFHPSFWPHHLH